MGVYEVTFSELQLQGKATVERLRKSPAQSLLVRRRDAEDLVLTTAARVELEHTAASVTTRMFVALMQRDGGVRELVTDVLPEVFPWVAFLSKEEVQEFVVDLVAMLRAAESLDNPVPVVQVIEAWRHTAEVMADPELAAILASDTDEDLGVVAAPVVS
ncbi:MULTISPECIES: hypothetical protein [Rhodococcus erythropolis group]|uniref:hypothetical protein n=1 Tax=Rhodococcus erythropolis group TaxID=2840174 RepID=UPI001BE7F84E|nr:MULTISPECIES: hypothetical protein [Rhodococcus erythropolis group]MBT2269675.1 hypothetical protein [Rhodococcus erythropolis]MBT2274192.1 hypothetical protein [Rhodococcus qingshengii]